MSQFMKSLLAIYMSFQTFQLFMGMVGFIIVVLILLAIQHGSRRAASESRDRSEATDEVEEDDDIPEEDVAQIASTPGMKENSGVGVTQEHETTKLGAEFTTIRLEQTVENRAIAFSEIQVFDITGQNIALGKPVSGSSFLPKYQPANAVDGDKSTSVQTTSELKAFMDIDFGVTQARTNQIDRILLYNFATMQERAIGVRILIMFRGAPLMATKPIAVARDEYEFKMDSFELLEPNDAHVAIVE